MAFSIWIRCSLVVAATLMALSALPARADILPGMPDAIVCSVKDPTGALPWERLVFFVSAGMRDGDTLYKSSTSDPVVLLVSAAGIVDGPNLADCDGWTIDALRAENRALSFTAPAPAR